MMLSLVIPRCDGSELLRLLAEGADRLSRVLPYPFEVVCVHGPGEDVPGHRPGIRWLQSDRDSHGQRVRVGMLGARGRYRVLLDPRWLVAPEQLQLLLPPVHTGFDICIGSRLVSGASCEQDRFIDRGKRLGWSLVASRFLTPKLLDALSPVQVYRSDAARALFSRALEEGHAITVETLSLADRMGLFVQEQPIDFHAAHDRRGLWLGEARDLLLALGRVRLRMESGAYPLLNLPLPPVTQRHPRA